MTEKLILAALVRNTSGTLQRVAGLFSRRGYNIDSLTVCETEDPRFSRMTIVCTTQPEYVRQICQQLLKLEIVEKVVVLNKENAVGSELLLVKVKAQGIDAKNAVLALNQKYGARVKDVTLKSMTLELTGTADVLEEFIDKVEQYGIIELARTGATALERGEHSIIDDVI